MSTRIIIADDHLIVQEGLEAAFAPHKDLAVVGCAPDGLSAVDLVERLQPDVAIMDVDMPRLNGIEATRRIAAMPVDTKVLALSRSPYRDVIIEMLGAGAHGYVVKTAPLDELLEGIRAVTAGRVFLCSHAAQNAYGNRMNDFYVFKMPRRWSLSPRERQILEYVSDGYTIEEIARFLNRSPKTVVTYRGTLMQKLGVDDVTGLVKYAMRKGLTS